jgi:peptide/nickel transport system substrate-binding protein
MEEEHIMKKKISILIAALLVISMFAACGGTTPAATPSPSASVSATPEASAEATPEATPEASEEPAVEDPNALPRDQTMYWNGLQWSAPNDYNPLSSNPNCWFMSQNDYSRVIVYETLYMFNQLDGKMYPLLADGDYVQEDNVFTIKIKKAAKWSDGTPLTANDVVYTFNIHNEMKTNRADMWKYISAVEAVDDYTVKITANNDPAVYNPLKVIEQFPKIFIMPEHQISQLVERNGGDPDKVKTDKNEDIVASGPYKPMFADNTKIVLVRDDNYWGQDASMWGKLAAPKYLAHNIFKDNNAGAVAFQQGEVDVAQQFMSEVWKMWEDQGLPVSTFIDEPPYYEGASIPTAIFNMKSHGLDRVEVRKALAMATDYNQIGTTAMSGYTLPISPSLMNPSAAEQGLINKDELKPLQWTGNQVDEANKLLDDAGIVDSDGDGIRDIDGKNISLKVECPTGWTDWNASLEIVAAAGKKIGLDITTYFPDAPTWTEDMQTGNFDIIMNSYPGASIANPWTRSYNTMYSNHGELVDADRVYWNYGRYSNEAVDKLIDQIPTADPSELVALYTELNKIYLTDVPTIGLMYRPSLFHTVNESVWTGFPEKDDGSNIPPTILTDGYGIAGLYNVELVK